jgi:hypothetical protein
MNVKTPLIAQRPAAPGGRAPERQAPHKTPRAGERNWHLREWSEQALDALLTALHTDRHRLSADEACTRRLHHDDNEVAHEPPPQGCGECVLQPATGRAQGSQAYTYQGERP